MHSVPLYSEHPKITRENPGEAWGVCSVSVGGCVCSLLVWCLCVPLGLSGGRMGLPAPRPCVLAPARVSCCWFIPWGTWMLHEYLSTFLLPGGCGGGVTSARRGGQRWGPCVSPRCQPAELGRGAGLRRYLFTWSGEPQWCYLFLPWLVSRQLLDAGSSAVPAGSGADTAAFHSPAQCPCVCSSKYSHLGGSLGMGEPPVWGAQDGGQPRGCRGAPKPQSS